MGVNGMLTAGELLLQWWLPRGFNFWLMDYPLGLSKTGHDGKSHDVMKLLISRDWQLDRRSETLPRNKRLVKVSKLHEVVF